MSLKCVRVFLQLGYGADRQNKAAASKKSASAGLEEVLAASRMCLEVGTSFQGVAECHPQTLQRVENLTTVLWCGRQDKAGALPAPAQILEEVPKASRVCLEYEHVSAWVPANATSAGLLPDLRWMCRLRGKTADRGGGSGSDTGSDASVEPSKHRRVSPRHKFWEEVLFGEGPVWLFRLVPLCSVFLLRSYVYRQAHAYFCPWPYAVGRVSRWPC